jgi:hypothetical protein
MSRVFLRPMIATAVLIVGVLAFGLWSWQAGRQRLLGFPMPRPGSTVDVEITLPFAPETFNIERLQAAGRLVRIAGRQVWLKSVSRGQLIALARLYWIGHIDPWRTP